MTCAAELHVAASALIEATLWAGVVLGLFLALMWSYTTDTGRTLFRWARRSLRRRRMEAKHGR